MLNTILFEDSKEIFSLEYIKNNGLNKSVTVISPGPDYADDFRKKMPDFPNVHVITISKFVKDQLHYLEKEISIVSKSKLMVDLSIIFKKYFSHLDVEIFFSAFKLFTELRSFTLKLESMLEILKDFDFEVVEVLSKFWVYLDIAEIVDEQKSYSLLADHYQNTPNRFGENHFVFFGFNHMNSQQIDLMKNLSQRTEVEVYIPFPKKVLKETRPSDWIQWVDTNNEYNTTKENDSLNSKRIECQTIRFTKGRLPNAILSRKDDEEVFDVLLATKKPSLLEINSVPLENYYFKSNADFFSSLVKDVFEKIRLLFMAEANVLTSALVEVINKEISVELSRDVSIRNFRKVKVLLMVKKSMISLLELSDENESLCLFNILVMERVLVLDLPRTYSVPLLSNNDYGEIYGIEGLLGNDSDRPTWVCMTSDHLGLKGGESSYNEKTASLLSAIGPIQRPELDYQITKFYMREILEKENTILFLEEGIEEEKVKIEELLDGFMLIEVDQNTQEKLPICQENKYKSTRINNEKLLKHNLSILSAQRMQTYLDCPKKYYYQYVEKLRLDVKTKSILRPDQLGVLEHKLIEDYFLTNDDYCNKRHWTLTQKTLDGFIEKEGIELTSLKYGKNLLEIYQYSKGGIKYLMELKSIDKNIKIMFEYDLSELDSSISGRVDSIVEGDFGVGVIDFKRSEFSIPSVKDLEGMDKIQIWFYLKHLREKFNEYNFFGYLNLSDIPSSKLFPLQVDKLETSIKYSKLKKTFDENLKEFEDFYEDTLTKMKNDKHFSSTPLNPSVCNFCVASKICSRSERE